MIYWTVVGLFVLFLMLVDVRKAVKSYWETGHPRSMVFNTADFLYNLSCWLGADQEDEDED